MCLCMLLQCQNISDAKESKDLCVARCDVQQQNCPHQPSPHRSTSLQPSWRRVVITARTSHAARIFSPLNARTADEHKSWHHGEDDHQNERLQQEVLPQEDRSQPATPHFKRKSYSSLTHSEVFIPCNCHKQSLSLERVSVQSIPSRLTRNWAMAMACWGLFVACLWAIQSSPPQFWV